MTIARIKATVEGTRTQWGKPGSSDIAVILDKDNGTQEATDVIQLAATGTPQKYHEWYVTFLDNAQSIQQVDAEYWLRTNSPTDTMGLYCDDGTNFNQFANVNRNTGQFEQVITTAISQPTHTTWDPARDFPGGSAGVFWGVTDPTGAGDTIICTAFELAVDYSVNPSGFAMYIASIVPPLMGLASHGLSLFEISQILCNVGYNFRRRLDGVLIYPNRPHELAAIREALIRRPRFAFLQGAQL